MSNPGLPEVTLIGTLCADPEITYVSTSGDAVANFTLAANSRRKNPDTGEWEDAATTFLRCSIWRDYAEHTAESLTRGMRVLATGRLKQRSWETDDGEKRSVMELAVDEIGPALRFATATVHKTTRSNGTGTGADGDQWSTTAPETATASESAPPF